MTRLASKLPERNGLAAHAEHFAAEPHRSVLVVGWARVTQVATVIDDDGDERQVPTVRLSAVEVVEGPDAKVARELLARARARRTGQEPLPYDDGVLDAAQAFVDASLAAAGADGTATLTAGGRTVDLATGEVTEA